MYLNNSYFCFIVFNLLLFQIRFVCFFTLLRYFFSRIEFYFLSSTYFVSL